MQCLLILNSKEFINLLVFKPTISKLFYDLDKINKQISTILVYYVCKNEARKKQRGII